MYGSGKESSECTVESEVYCPRRWAVLAVGAIFLLAGGVGFWAISGDKLPVVGFWIAKVITAVVALSGGTVVAWAVGSIIWPASVCHAAPDMLADVPREPVICEGLIAHGRLTHELCEEAEGWQFRPSARLWCNDRAFLFGFGLIFSLVFAGLMAWVLHSQLHLASWPVSAACGAIVTAVCFSSVMLLLGMLTRSGYRRLSRLSVPRNGNDIELDCPEELDVEKTDLTAGLKWLLLGEMKRQQLSIPRELVAAVQLCPWKYTAAVTLETCFAVEGLLVLASPEKAYHRIPILLTLDYVGAAKLMQKLAEVLQVPYLFCADSEGWKAEMIRARERPPLRAGGMQT
jgi:hypothetical protein